MHTIVRLLTVTSTLALLHFSATPVYAEKKEVSVQINPQNLMGKWYEIARLPNFFQGKDTVEAADTYSMNPDGSIKVIYSHREKTFKAPLQTMEAKMWQSKDKKGTGEFKIQFFWPFSADYWIIQKSADHMVIGYPDKSMMWIMSKKPQMAKLAYKKALSFLKHQGYDITKVVKTPQPLNTQ